MISYIPFLKAKQGELTAVSELATNVRERICPFFDFPRKKKYDAALFASKTVRIAGGLKRHWGAEREFYFDDLDVKDKLTVEGQQQYAYVLGALKGLRVIPVVGLDRSMHNAAVVGLKRNGETDSPIVAFRAHPQDFEDFEEQKAEIEYGLDDVFKEFKEIDLVFDCQLCTGLDVSTTAQQIADFAQKFSAAYKKVRRVIVTGSCIPPSIRDVLGTDDATTLPRRELEIMAKTRDLFGGDVVAGDYATVSPFYSDADLDPKLLQKVMTPRLIYPFERSFYITRGSSLQSGGQDQYVGLTKELCGQGFFRPGYSLGEDYFSAKSKGIGKRAMNGTVVKPSVVAHITYMVLGAKL